MNLSVHILLPYPDCCLNRKSVGDGECNPENLNDFCMNDGRDCCNKEIGPGNRKII